MVWMNFACTLTVTAAVILLVKKAAGTMITPRGHMLMWLLIGVVTVGIPLGAHLPQWIPETGWSLRAYIPQVTETIYYEQDIPGNDGIRDNEIMMRENTISMKLPPTGERVEKRVLSAAEKADRRLRWAGMVWAVGAAAAGIWVAGSAWQYGRRLKALPECREERAVQVFEVAKASMGIRRRIPLKTGAGRIMLAGLRQPAIYLAGDGSQFTEEELRQVLVHELVHYRHRDLWLNVIAAGFFCGFWWNPVVWLAFRRFRLDMEVYCDFHAAEVTGDRQAYARTLVKAASGQRQVALAAASLAEEEHQVVRRVKCLAKSKNPRLWARVLGVCVLLGVGAALVVNPAEQQPELTAADTELLYLYMWDKEGNEVLFDLDGQQETFLEIFDGNGAVWRDLYVQKGDGRDPVSAYYLNWTEPAAVIRFHNFAEYLSSYFIPGEDSVKLYTWNGMDRGIVILERKGGKRFMTDSAQVWDSLKAIIAEETFLRDVDFQASARDANWIYDGTLHRKDFEEAETGEALQEYLWNLGPADRMELGDEETDRYLADNPFDYWVDLQSGSGGHKIIGHLADEPDGTGKTCVISPEVGSGYVLDDPELARLLADAVKIEFLREEQLIH